MSPLANATSEEEIEEYIRNTSRSGLHPIGTAAISPKVADWGVVNPDLLVKEVSRLRIVDASVIVGTFV